VDKWVGTRKYIKIIHINVLSVSFKIAKLMQTLIERCCQEMKREGFREEELTLFKSLDLRYVGQSFELNIPFNYDFLSVFHQNHHQRYGYCNEEKEVEVVNLRLKMLGQRRKPALTGSKETAKKKAPIYEKREMIFEDKPYKGFIYLRKDLKPGHYLAGPALIIDYGSTTVLPPEIGCKVDPYQSLMIERENS